MPYKIGSSEIAKRWGPHVAKVMGATTGAVVEGGLWGAGEGISEAMVGEPEEAAEHILSSIGTNALIGGAFGGAVSAAVPMLTGAKGVAAKMADKLLDGSGASGEYALNKTRKMLVRIAVKEHNLSEGAANKLAELLTPGLTGKEAHAQLRDLIRAVDGHATDLARFIDAQLLTDDFLQMADRKGFSKEFIKKQILNTRQGYEQVTMGSSKAVQAARARLKKLRKEQAKLDEQIVEISEKEGATGYKKRREQIRKDIEREQRIAGEVRFRVGDERPTMPRTSSEVIENARAPINQLRQDLVDLARKEPRLDANGELSEIIHNLNMAELELYAPLFSDEVLHSIRSRASDNQPSQLELWRQIIKTQRQQKKVDNWFEFWKVRLDGPKFDEMVKLFDSKAEKARLQGEPLAGIDKDELRYCLQIAFDTGDITDLLALADRYGVNKRRLVSGSGSRWETIEPMISELRSLNIDEDKLGGKLWEERFRKAQGMWKRHKEKPLSSDRVKREVAEGRMPVQGYLDMPSGRYAVDPRTGLDTYQYTIREALEEDMAILGNMDVFLDDTFIQSWKILEQSQTELLDAMNYGFLGKHQHVEALINEFVDKLRRSMKDPEKWGEMAIHKDEFDRLYKEFSELKNQNLVDFTEGVGLDQVASSSKILSHLRELDSFNSDVTSARLTGYAEKGRRLLREMREKFEPAALADVPDSVKLRINQKLKNNSSLPLGSPKLALDPRAEWGARLDEVDKFLGDVQGNMDQRLHRLRDDLPLANLLMGPQGKSGNMNQTLRELGRGGFIGAGLFALTGSPQVAVAGGALAGAAGMAQNPRQLVGLVHQLRSVREASKEGIAEYMKAWEKDIVPKSAIHKGWEMQARQAFMVASKALGDTRQEGRGEIRRKERERKAEASLKSRIQTAIGSELTDENFFELRDSLTQLNQSPLIMERFLEEVTKPFEATPDIQRYMKVSIKKHVSMAVRSIPRTTRGSMFAEEYPPTPIQLQAFNRVLQVLTDPTETIMTSMLTGTMTVDMVETLKEAWPKIYQDMAEQAFEILGDRERVNALSQRQKQTLAILLNTPISDPNEFKRLQENYVPDEGQGGGQAGPGGQGVTTPADVSGIGTTTSVVERPRQ
jgi:hypothetical protein